MKVLLSRDLINLCHFLFNRGEVNTLRELAIQITGHAPYLVTQKHSMINYRVGERPAATQAAIQTPWAELHARIDAGTPAPPVETPATPPAAATQATQTVLHPV